MPRLLPRPAAAAPPPAFLAPAFVAPAFVAPAFVAYALPLGALAALAVVLGVQIVGRTGGLFVYTLDDPYIHLALAENMAQGQYGVNAGEPSAPSSSILWPLLLTPFARWSGAVWVPLLLNLLAAAGTVAVLVRLGDLVAETIAAAWRPWAVGFAVMALLPLTNLLGLVFTGMEHTLQVFLAVSVVYGLAVEARTGAVRWWLVAALVAGPLVRYELLAVTLPALAVLFIRQHFRAAIGSGLGVVVLLAAFSAFLLHLGLNAMPSSILAKSDAVADTGRLETLYVTFRYNLRHPEGKVLLTGALWLLGAACWPRRPFPERLAAGATATTLLLHLAVGGIDWYHRYEVYAWVNLLATLAYTHRARLAALGQWPLRWTHAATAAAVAVTLWPGQTYTTPLRSTPQAAENIFAQQYQMHRLIQEVIQAPVAVNDLGWTAFRNDRYVLDLFGLGSTQALLSRRYLTPYGPSWMGSLATQHGVRAALLYDEWFLLKPPTWVPIAKLHLEVERITPAFTTVAIYATDAADAPTLRAHLAAFAPTLPPSARLEVLPAAPTPAPLAGL